MPQARPDRWKRLPGNYDVLNARELFPSNNEWGIPTLAPEPLSVRPPWLVPYGTRVRSKRPIEGAVHFFLDDFRFERTWSRAYEALESVTPFPIALTPDFSLYSDWPLVAQLWNTYRNRWVGCYWQRQGLRVIPTLSWSIGQSLTFAFAGVPRYSMVAVSTVGVDIKRDAAQFWHFMEGFEAMLDAVAPSAVLCYGKAPAEAHALALIHEYPTYWRSLEVARREAAQQQEAKDGR